MKNIKTFVGFLNEDVMGSSDDLDKLIKVLYKMKEEDVEALRDKVIVEPGVNRNKRTPEIHFMNQGKKPTGEKLRSIVKSQIQLEPKKYGLSEDGQKVVKLK